MSDPLPADGPVAVFGGTYNPVHFGHLRSALELVEKLELAQLRMMPSAVPPLREQPGCSAADRAAMVELAVAGEPTLVCDSRELARSGKSYTYDSLAQLRAEAGSERSLSMVLGCDALHHLNRWYRWQELLTLAHVVVIARPGWRFPDTGDIGDWLAGHRSADPDQLRETAAGTVLVEELRPLDIASTDIRALLASGRSARYLVPESVLNYIYSNELYC